MTSSAKNWAIKELKIVCSQNYKSESSYSIPNFVILLKLVHEN